MNLIEVAKFLLQHDLERCGLWDPGVKLIVNDEGPRGYPEDEYFQVTSTNLYRNGVHIGVVELGSWVPSDCEVNITEDELKFMVGILGVGETWDELLVSVDPDRPPGESYYTTKQLLRHRLDRL